MLFGRRKPGYTTTVDGAADPEQVVLDLQKAEMAAKKKPKAEVFSIDAASETARRLKETGSTFDGSAAKGGRLARAGNLRSGDGLLIDCHLHGHSTAEALRRALVFAGRIRRRTRTRRRQRHHARQQQPKGSPDCHILFPPSDAELHLSQ